MSGGKQVWRGVQKTAVFCAHISGGCSGFEAYFYDNPVFEDTILTLMNHSMQGINILPENMMTGAICLSNNLMQIALRAPKRGYF